MACVIGDGMEQYLSLIQETNPGLRLHIEQIYTEGT